MYSQSTFQLKSVIGPITVCLLALLLPPPPTEGSFSLLELSYTYLWDAPTMPKVRALELKTIKKGLNKFGIWVELNEICTSEHSGTHLDAPVHFSEDGWSVDQIPLDRLYQVPGVRVDVSAQASKFKNFNNYEVDVRALERWESAHGTIPDGAVVFIHTGWGALSKNITAYSGVDQHNMTNFPGLSIDLARWLAGHGLQHGHEKGIVGVGIDTFSLDVGNSVKYPSHVVLLGNNIYGLENVANTHRLPPKGFTVTVLPLKVGGGSGSPVRIVADLTQKEPAAAAGARGTLTTVSSTTTITIVALMTIFGRGIILQN